MKTTKFIFSLIIALVMISNLMAQPTGDRDGDGIPDKEDKCPDQPGLRIFNGCPESNKSETTGSGTPTVTNPSPLNWKAAVDSVRELFLKGFDLAGSDNQRLAELNKFSNTVFNSLNVRTSDGLEYAIAPVMRSRFIGKPQLARMVARGYEMSTGFFYHLSIALLPTAEYNQVREMDADVQVAKKAEKEKIEPVAAKPLTPEEICAAEAAKIGVKGRTYFFHSHRVILGDYDCEKKQYYLWRPRQSNDLFDAPVTSRLIGRVSVSLDKLKPSDKQYYTCNACDGTGKKTDVYITTKVKELPWGYFSGVETKSIRQTKTEVVRDCSTCRGLAVVLK